MTEPANQERDSKIWEEIMRSPLDPDPDGDQIAWPRVLLLFGTAVIGLALGYFWSGSGENAQPTAVSIAPTTTTPPPPDPVFPPGYSETSDVGLRPMASFSVGGKTFLIVSSAVRSDLDRIETDELHVAEWVLAGDGVEAVASRAIHSEASPGLRLVEFPSTASLPISVPELRFREATEMVVRSGCNGCAATSVDMAEGEVILESDALPYRNSEPLLITVGNGINLSIDELHAAPEWGFVDWHLIDETGARARVTLVVAFEGTDDPATEGTDPTLLVPTHAMGPNQQNPVAGSADSFSRDGWQHLDRVGEILTEDNQPEQLTLRWSVEWQHPVGDPTSLPLGDVIDLGSFE